MLARFRFDATIIKWRGPAPYLFVPVPDEFAGEIRYAARIVSYGWGVIPVEATLNAVAFTTSLFPRGDTYLLPVKMAVQREARVGLDDDVAVVIEIRAR
ncbi:DUF1905 domain-containing protein [Sphingomonas ginkgonis]|uniref:DUF1905 domain-containing protein n=1 Tax=Sphingomonas ginkgonis TaxID=2315330 RepID=A0A429VE52_9SPHN|nr:DUF1905 domain-containing protein [Sphingomonas ginkgonis]RST32295.1 DUF1905 domain-containing protein [Sphingomonas ginkgonis]